MTAPLAGLNRPSWQGQTIVPAGSSHITMQPRCVQIAEYAFTPAAVLITIAGLEPTETTVPGADGQRVEGAGEHLAARATAGRLRRDEEADDRGDDHRDRRDDREAHQEPDEPPTAETPIGDVLVMTRFRLAVHLGGGLRPRV